MSLSSVAFLPTKTKQLNAYMRLDGICINNLDYIILKGQICGLEEVSQMAILHRKITSLYFSSAFRNSEDTIKVHFLWKNSGHNYMEYAFNISK
jgi:hypothetical protein